MERTIESARIGSPMSGNPVKIGDGCATVTDYEFPEATVRLVP